MNLRVQRLHSCGNPFSISLVFRIEDKNDPITVYDGDVSAFVVLGQRHGGSLRRGHNPNGPAVVGTLQVGSGSEIGRLHAQTLRQGEGLSRAVATVGLVPPLHHRVLDGARLVLTREDHGLEEHRKPLLLPHRDMDTITRTHWRRQDKQGEKGGN